jgi:hypothetical protein
MAFTPFNPEAEDNSDANSFVSVAYLRQYADDRGKGINLPSDDRACERLLIQGMDYIASKSDRLLGELSDEAQPLPFPRAYVFINGSSTSLDDATIPDGIMKAQCEIACTIASGVELYPVTAGQIVKREKVDVLETEYFEPDGNEGLPVMPLVDALLAPFFGGGGLRVRTVRV